jgi:hypothetical protein
MEHLWAAGRVSGPFKGPILLLVIITMDVAKDYYIQKLQTVKSAKRLSGGWERYIDCPLLSAFFFGSLSFMGARLVCILLFCAFAGSFLFFFSTGSIRLVLENPFFPDDETGCFGRRYA